MSPVPMASALAFTTHTMMDKADLQRFPVLRLDENIKLDLRKYASAKIRESVESTLENEILYTDLDGIIDKTAYISVIKYMPDTNERDDDRIFTLLDHIRNTPAWNPKFESMTVYLFNLWARQNNIPDYPFPDWESPPALSDIQLFLATYNR